MATGESVLSSPPRRVSSPGSDGQSSSSPRRRPRLSLGTRFDASVPPQPNSSSGDVHASPRTASTSAASESNLSTTNSRHRHSDTIQSALNQLKVLAGETSAPAATVPTRVGIVKCLEAAGWQHQSTTDGVRIFTKAPDHELGSSVQHKAMTMRTTMTDALTQGVGRQAGIRKDEDLPWIRGEAFIAGSWNPVDVAHTVLNQAARALWDPRFDAIGSDTVEFLNESDTLWSMLVRGELGSDREGALVSTIDNDKRNKTAYVASVSVEDPLLIRQAPRTTIHLNGWCLRSLRRAPPFEEPPPKPNDEESPATPSRPGHRRLKSSMSIKNTGMLSPSFLPPPLPTMDAMSYFPSVSLVRQNSTGADSAHNEEEKYKDVNPLDFPHFAVPRTRGSLPATNPAAAAVVNANDSDENRPGLHVSFITHVSPGFNLSQTVVNQLALHLPLLIASIGRYLTVRGFAPWVQRLPKRDGLVILDEQYQPLEGCYRLVFRVDGVDEGPATKIRFHGHGFGKGRFEVVVENALDDWQLEYDVEPKVQPETQYVDEHENDEEADAARRMDAKTRPPPPRRRKTSMSVKASPLTISTNLAGTNEGTGQTSAGGPSVVSPLSATSRLSLGSNSANAYGGGVTMDPASLPGPLGACTLVIPRHSSTRYHPITVTISRNSTIDTLNPLDKLSNVHQVLGPAIRSSSNLSNLSSTISHSLFDSVEDMLEARNESSDKMAKLRLRAVSDLLRQVRENEERLRGERDNGYVDKLARELAEDVGHHQAHLTDDDPTVASDVNARRRASGSTITKGMQGSLGLEGMSRVAA
ncbi:hypothetical protein ACM66B_000096 [Microbotryomycetes sp. NB124-2]